MGTEQNHEVHVGENLLETIGKLRQSIAATHWAGSTDTNIYQLLAELMTVVEALAKTTSSHTHTAPHGGTTPPNQSGAITAHGNQAKQLHDKLTPLI
ncbi:hypothetical protein [Shewanella marina]|uniref:hypothetical protein n=1 Tax=Shewanella marina TaxID=487319 RepID=UPI000471281D|nr:hypothetical protein [Shewanella marina]